MSARDTDALLEHAVGQALRPGVHIDAPRRMRLGPADWLVLGGYPLALVILVVLGISGGWQ